MRSLEPAEATVNGGVARFSGAHEHDSRWPRVMRWLVMAYAPPSLSYSTTVAGTSGPSGGRPHSTSREPDLSSARAN